MRLKVRMRLMRMLTSGSTSPPGPLDVMKVVLVSLWAVLLLIEFLMTVAKAFCLASAGCETSTP